ncbi:TPA: hypothetical protein ORS32_000697 [Escherichia coli]|uniref:hypothetical protein n=1 Tax=Escherichia coli TaxID=562 RepID=UPI0017A54A52|nr:hypothetical protein [Escherichia coli]ELK2414444.1 hypothetical protein [Salmonella enterica]EFH8489312.1 hypothetical protein [Escherichia coli]EHH6722697.1 hypothetical protein [Escherichia coli]EHZ4787946.1 hypothetical protein [Escherichia coli]
MSLESLSQTSIDIFDKEYNSDSTKNLFIKKCCAKNNIKSSSEAKKLSALFGASSFFADNQIAIDLPSNITTAPNSLDDGLTLKSKLDAAKVKATNFLNAKTVTLTKHLDAYGVIDSIDYNKKKQEINISARIYNILDHEFVDEITFLGSEFSISDQKKLVENAIFYWHVGIEKNIFGREKHVSEFRLRRVALR